MRAGRPRRSVVLEVDAGTRLAAPAAWSSGAAASPTPSARPSWRPPAEMGPARQVEACGRAAPGGCGACSATTWWPPGWSGRGRLAGCRPERRRRGGRLRHDPPGERRQAVAAPGRAGRPGRRGLELVLYPEPRSPPRPGDHGSRSTSTPAPDAFHVSFDPADEPAHWFVLDLAILRAHGRTLTGPPPAELVGPIPTPLAAGGGARLPGLAPGQRARPAAVGPQRLPRLALRRGGRLVLQGGRRRLGPGSAAATRPPSPPPWPSATATPPTPSTPPASAPSRTRSWRRWRGRWAEQAAGGHRSGRGGRGP